MRKYIIGLRWKHGRNKRYLLLLSLKFYVIKSYSTIDVIKNWFELQYGVGVERRKLDTLEVPVRQVGDGDAVVQCNRTEETCLSKILACVIFSVELWNK